ncbi:pyridoxamine 5'-phosphate oxidase family protein [Longirhabdus pacifica]|uniref:pyridoxamine 5'-phosphate oxidase family protein n=1 Tax=Longirhabdus pacifica TaxID=2305227 RepID=UPI0013E8C968|nr:pyridoxamine 5'-phosphate oxidase family protein [Longirhabdus pacifica]
MASYFHQLEDKHIQFIHEQHMFFVATAPTGDGRINLSPKGYDCLKIMDHHHIGYMDYSGSGNETANHISENKKITFMWCSYTAKPLILRVYGYGKVLHKGTDTFISWTNKYFPNTPPERLRQVITCEIEAVQTSCGYAVPIYDFVEERKTLDIWTDNKLKTDALDKYNEKNAIPFDEKFPILNK